MSSRLFALRTSKESVASGPVAVSRPRTAPLQEAGALLLIAAAVYLTVSLLSLRLDPSDPRVGGSNWGGPVGAWVAGVLARGFGAIAWLAPVELALLGSPLFRVGGRPMPSLRFAGDLVLAIVLSALIYVILPSALVFGHAPVGGNVGLLFGELMQALFSTLGSLLVGGTVVGLILIGRSSFSFIELCDWVSRMAGLFVEHCRAAIAQMRGAWIEARALRSERAAEEAQRQKPAIEESPGDAVILAHLEDDDGDWVAIEQTGAPPLAISVAFRER